MYLKINNKDKFYKKINFYRTKIFFCTTFKTNSKDKEIIFIINALNIKNRKKRIEYVYNESIKQIDNYYKDKNLCDFKNNQCIFHRNNKKELFFGCCRMCEHKSNKECTTKNIPCKLFYCSYIKNSNKILKYEDIKILKTQGILDNYILKNDYFTQTEDSIKDIIYGIILAPLRIIYRYIRKKN